MMSTLIKGISLYLALLVLPFLFLYASVYGTNIVKNSQEIEKHTKIGVASWYGRRFHGRKTASGTQFNMYSYTAAHRSLPLGTKVRVLNLKNGKNVIVKINDRGPYIKGRMIDLSYAAAKSIDIIEPGLEMVKVEVLALPKG